MGRPETNLEEKYRSLRLHDLTNGQNVEQHHLLLRFEWCPTTKQDLRDVRRKSKEVIRRRLNGKFRVDSTLKGLFGKEQTVQTHPLPSQKIISSIVRRNVNERGEVGLPERSLSSATERSQIQNTDRFVDSESSLSYLRTIPSERSVSRGVAYGRKELIHTIRLITPTL